ncbi:MAG: sorbosone dehydrogenase family protein [Planctomycetota bacterium]|nr:sorbosone dehydrogenase family protein [Planctomycetaceae bacterium]MDQ3331265.1 sorbosone dehydrogenase family protein [Planctomycetota bacterium]
MMIRLFLASSCLTSFAAAAEIKTEVLKPEPIRISIDELPEPNLSESANQHPQVIPVPEDAVLKAPAGFTVNLVAEIPQARWLAVTPAGELLCVSSRTNTIFRLPDTNGDGVADEKAVFADEQDGLNMPFGMAFLKDGFYVGNTNGVVRFEYEKGQKELEGPPKTITDLPGQGYNEHWTRNVIPAPDGGLFVSVGSKSNADIEEPPRASVLSVSADGSRKDVYAFGLRNPVGLAIHPQTKQLYATVNERDKIGDGLVPDYFTSVKQGAFYGWPYAYLKPSLLDPRHVENGKSVRPELAEKTTTPDVLFEAHSAALGLAFYTADENAASAFPERYRQGAFVAFRGSWNRSEGTGYKIVFVPFNDEGRPEGGYEDFVTGFLTDPAGPTTFGRPVGTTILPDGSLAFTEEGNGRVYRVSYQGE